MNKINFIVKRFFSKFTSCVILNFEVMRLVLILIIKHARIQNCDYNVKLSELDKRVGGKVFDSRL